MWKMQLYYCINYSVHLNKENTAEFGLAREWVNCVLER